jgi:pyruvate,water dikinase
MGKYVLRFSDEECSLDQITGGKAASLARLSKNGFSVPEGIAVTVKAFEDFCSWNKIDVRDHVHDHKIMDEIKTSILNGEYPRELKGEIDFAVEQLLSAQGSESHGFAVRSSAVGEDGLLSSMAGQMRTFLYVPGESVKQKIKECWASQFDQRAISYRAGKNCNNSKDQSDGDSGIDPSFGMGVVVQRQIDPSYAGVIFSIDPLLRSADHMVAEWVPGIGEKLVSGHVVPERLFIHRRNPKLPDELDDSIKVPLAAAIALALRAEGLSGYPVDVEWCTVEDKVYILQSRPVTALADNNMAIFTNVNIGENYPRALSPFTWSIVDGFRANYFKTLFRRIGLPEGSIQDAAPVIDNLLGVRGGMVYYNLGNWYEMMALFPFGSYFKKFLDHYIGQHIPFTYNAKGDVLRMFSERRHVVLQARFWLRLSYSYLTLKRAVDNFEENFSKRRKSWRAKSFADQSIDELESNMVNIVGFLEKDWGGGAIADFSAMVFPGLLQMIAASWLKGIDEISMARFLQGLTLKSTESSKLLWKIAQRFSEEPDLKSLLIDGEYEELDKYIGLDRRSMSGISEKVKCELDEIGPAKDVKKLVSSFMEQFGGRCYQELMITSPTFEERTDLFWDLVKGYMLSTGKDPNNHEQVERDGREQFTRDRLKELGFVKRIVFKKLLGDAQAGIGYREKARLCQSLIYGELRRVVLEIGRRLVGKGYFESGEDVFYLDHQELVKLLQGRFLFPETIPEIVSVRKKAHLAADLVEQPEFYLANKAEYSKLEETKEHVAKTKSGLRGLGVSRGTVVGRARIVLNPTEQNRLSPGEILVTKVTDPGWTPLFLIAGGLILEKGGLLSHGAIVAREFGIPAVVGVKDAVKQIEDGRLVCVDAESGEIKILQEDNEENEGISVDGDSPGGKAR